MRMLKLLLFVLANLYFELAISEDQTLNKDLDYSLNSGSFIYHAYAPHEQFNQYLGNQFIAVERKIDNSSVDGAKVFDDPETIFVAHELAAQDIRITKANTVVPDVTFKDDMVISLGGHTVELRYHGPNDGRGSISMLFQPEKLLFVVDWIVLGRMPWQKLWSYDIQGMINSTTQALELDFDVFVGGHADIGKKADVQRYLTYIQTLYSAVIDGIHSGKSLEEMKQSIKLSSYSDIKQYEEWLPLNIEGVYERLMEESGMGWRPDIKQ